MWLVFLLLVEVSTVANVDLEFLRQGGANHGG